MSKEKELAKNTAIITLGKICTQLVSFLLLPLYTSLLSTEEYGAVDLVLTYSSLLLPVITLALDQAVFRFLIDVRNDEEKKKSVIQSVFRTSALLFLIVSVVIIVIQAFIQNGFMIYFWLVLLATTISSILLQLARGLGDSIGYTVGSTVIAVIQVICNVIFLVGFGMGAEGMMLAIFVGNMLGSIFLSKRCNLFYYLHGHQSDKAVLKEMLGYSIPLIPNQLSWWVLNASDRVIVSFFIGIAGNGIIAVANKFPSVYIQFSNIFNISWTESAALHIDDKDAKRFFTNTIVSVYRLFLCLCCGMIVALPFVFPVMINKQYNEAYNLIPIYMISSLANAVVSLYGVIYVARKRTKEIAQTAMYAAAINAVSHLALIKFIGLYAAAISTLLGYGCMAIYRYYHSRRYLVIKFDTATLLSTVVLIAVSLVSYYSRKMVFQIVVFIIITIFSYVFNKEILNSAFKTVKEKFLKR